MNSKKSPMAYHFTRPDLFTSILKDGALVPINVRIDDESMRRLCENSFNARSGIRTYRGLKIPGGQEAVLEYFLENRPPSSKRATFAPKNSMYNSGCLEVIFGYGDGILLSPGRFLDTNGAHGHYGFIFNAEDLVERGAVVLEQTYDNVLVPILEGMKTYHGFPALQPPPGEPPFKSPETIQELIELSERIHELTELGGQKAMEMVRGYPRGFYIYWRGSLPLEWAVAVIEDGKKITL